MYLASNNTFYIIISSLLLLFIAIVTLGICYSIKKHGNPWYKMTHEIDKKLWMTFGLGITFFGAYVAVVFAFAKFFDLSKLFLFLYKFPLGSIYIGLFIFGFTTGSIYVVRHLIKKFYFFINR